MATGIGPRPWGVGPWGTGAWSDWPDGRIVLAGAACAITLGASARAARVKDVAARQGVVFGFSAVGATKVVFAGAGLHIDFALTAEPTRIMFSGNWSQIAFGLSGRGHLTWEIAAPCEDGAWPPTADCETGAWTPLAACKPGAWVGSGDCRLGAWQPVPDGEDGEWEGTH